MSARSGSKVRTLIVLLAIAAIGFSLVVVHSPESLPEPVLETADDLADLDQRLLLTMLGAGIAIVGLLSLWTWRARDRSDRLGSLQVEAADRDADIAGSKLTEQFLLDRSRLRTHPLEDEGTISETLRAVLLELYAVELGSQEAAIQHVDAGEWTQDRYAAAFVTASEAVDYPVYFRLLGWLYPTEAYEYRARRALRTVERSAEQLLTDYEAPAHPVTWRSRLERLSSLAESGVLDSAD